MRTIQQGFSLIELMIVVAIVGVLAAVATANYQTYMKKSKFSEVIQAAMPYKTAFEVAAQGGSLASLVDADAGTNGIPVAPSPSGKVASLDVADGVITVTGTTEVDSKTFTMSASGITAPIQWTKGGTCAAAGLC